MNRSARNKRGTVLIAALVALAVVMAMLGGMLQGTLRLRRQMHAERNLRQCELLLAAGVQRAALRSRDAEYQGETWSLAAAEIIAQGEGRVTIEPIADSPGQFRVVAEYPLGEDTSVRRSRTVSVHRTSSKTSPIEE